MIKLLKKLFGLDKSEPVVEPTPVPKKKRTATRKKAAPKTTAVKKKTTTRKAK